MEAASPLLSIKENTHRTPKIKFLTIEMIVSELERPRSQPAGAETSLAWLSEE